MTYRGPDAKDQWPYICSRSACGRRLPRPLTDLCIDCLPGAHDDLCQTCGAGVGDYDGEEPFAAVPCQCAPCVRAVDECDNGGWSAEDAADCGDQWHDEEFPTEEYTP